MFSWKQTLETFQNSRKIYRTYFMKENAFKGYFKEKRRNYPKPRKKGEGRILDYCSMKAFTLGN